MKEIEVMMKFILDYGIAVAFLGYFVWKDWRRDNRVYDLVGALTDYLKGKLETEEELKKLKDTAEDNKYRIIAVERKLKPPV